MPDFSPSGIYSLPALTLDTLRLGGDPRVLGWIQEAVQEGDLLNRTDPSYEHAEKGMRYIIGDQKDPVIPHMQYVPYMTINKSRKSVQAHVSALTDVKPVFGYRTFNQRFTFHANLLNELVVAWWVESLADITLGSCIKYALGTGTGDLAVEWDPGAAYGTGDHKIVAKDYRDTLPIRPSTDPNPQTWQGVIFREAHAVNSLRQKYPNYEQAFRPAPDNLLTTVMSRFRRVVARLQTPSGDTLSGLAGLPQARALRPGDIVLYRCYLNDYTRNLTSKPIPMGDPSANWSYVADPGERLYPQKRLIVCTPELVLYDGPNPYWHSMYPFCRLKLWDVPWCFLGLSLLDDTMPIQDGINDTMKDIRLGLKQWVNPDVQFEKRATARAFQQAFDPQRPGKKIAIDTLGAHTQEPYKKHDGPSPQALALLLQVYQQLNTEHDELTGVANLQQLLQLRQLPGADTLQKYYEALTPELRQEGRQVEAFLRDLAQMFKFNIFQFMDSARRRNLLGDSALALEDLDEDPNLLVPAMSPVTQDVDPASGLPIQSPNPEYVPELDAERPRSDRAKYFARLFSFIVAPNSILAMAAQEKKMMNFQLARMGYLDFWTLHESLETPNVGTPPPIPLPMLQPPASPDELIQGVAMGKYMPDPARPGNWLEVRVPMTVTERLMAQQMMGIGMTENPAGRKASGQQGPEMEEKSDGEGGSRQTVTESSK